eukprot:10119972-Alexandrium_andersonii.AAC.1
MGPSCSRLTASCGGGSARSPPRPRRTRLLLPGVDARRAGHLGDLFRRSAWQRARSPVCAAVSALRLSRFVGMCA